MSGKKIKHIDLTNPKELQTLVENRRVFNLQNCELNIFESYQLAYRVPLTFNDFVITSMVRGKKVMHLEGKEPFAYLPGETVIMPAGETMRIDFPEAQADNPSQCIALAVDERYILDTLSYLNEFYNSDKESEHDWHLQFNQYHFPNDTEISELINKIIRICSSAEVAKNIYADLNLKELLIRLLQSQYLEQVSTAALRNPNQGKWEAVIDHIHKNLTEKINVEELSNISYLNRSSFFKSFKEQFGLTPIEYINRERFRVAKRMLSETDLNITEISWQAGFSDVNYFSRLFKKHEGITPSQFRDLLQSSTQFQ